jgi:hypothetical protein
VIGRARKNEEDPERFASVAWHQVSAPHLSRASLCHGIK